MESDDKIIISKSHLYVYLMLSLLGSFWTLSLFEIFITQENILTSFAFWTSLLFRLLNDFWAIILIAILLLPLYYGLMAIHKKVGLVLTIIIFLIIVLFQFVLVKYSMTTLINLGSDILGYSIDDISLTVSSTKSVSIISTLSSVLPLIIFLVLYKIIKKKGINEKKISLIFSSLLVLFGGLKLIAFEAAEGKHKNKIHFLVSDIIRFQLEKNEIDTEDFESRNDYPLIKPFSETQDVLSPFFSIKDEKPNIVMIIVEGLGSEFVGDYAYGGFTPFLDSLIPKSLFWENFVSTTSRTFGVMPSLLGSLPFGDKGFLEIRNTPSHISLLNILKSNGYTTSFYAGHNSSFDRKINFLEYNDIDNVVDESKFGPEYVKTEENKGGFAWGYPDAEIFRKTLNSSADFKQPRFDVIMTLSTHEPFDFPEKKEYLLKAESILNSKKNFKIDKDEFRNDLNIFSALLYTDTAIKSFIEGYSARSDFDNTIFVITGDHRLIPITQKDRLCRYHVPFFIYSPMLKKTARFKSISSHFDVAPSLVSMLMNNYDLNKVEETAWLGTGIDTARQFRNIHKIPLMRYKGKISDFLYEDYLYSDDELFKINENFGTYKVKDDAIKMAADSSLKAFKKMNSYITLKNRIYPDSLNIYAKSSIQFSKQDLDFIQTETKGLVYDDVFRLAREYAFNKDYKKSRLLCDYILNELPNHFDARILKGRTLAWEGDYKLSEYELSNVLKRTPYYNDAYLAILDMYWWSGQDNKSISIYSKALNNKVLDPNISFKLAKAYVRMNKVEEATIIVDSVLIKNPENEEFIKFKQSLK